jgi:hypothetical protein
LHAMAAPVATTRAPTLNRASDKPRSEPSLTRAVGASSYKDSIFNSPMQTKITCSFVVVVPVGHYGLTMPIYTIHQYAIHAAIAFKAYANSNNMPQTSKPKIHSSYAVAPPQDPPGAEPWAWPPHLYAELGRRGRPKDRLADERRRPADEIELVQVGLVCNLGLSPGLDQMPCQLVVRLALLQLGRLRRHERLGQQGRRRAVV